MSGDNADLQAKLAALRTQFGDGLAERMRDLEAAADGIAAPLDDNGFAAVKTSAITPTRCQEAHPHSATRPWAIALMNWKWSARPYWPTGTIHRRPISATSNP